MTEFELLRIITFLERMRQPYDRMLNAAEPDPNWNIILYLMKHHLRGENVTMSSLASATGVPFASAMRRIHKMIDEVDIQLRKRGLTGKYVKTAYVSRSDMGKPIADRQWVFL